MSTAEVVLASVEETESFGSALATLLMPGDLIYLDGQLGAGKTTLVKAVGTALGISRDAISSPTFNLIHEHKDGTIPLYHFDIYRITNAHELNSLAFDDYLSAADGVIIIEWAVNVENLPMDALRINLSLEPSDENVRRMKLSAGGPRSNALVSMIDWQQS